MNGILLSMAKQKGGRLNYLERHLPEGLLVDAAWLSKKGYSTSLRSQYLAAGWLKRPTRQVYQRPRGSLSWQQAVISLQTLLGSKLAVGSRTALELQGYAHYLPQQTKEVHLYGPERPPKWLNNLRTGVHFFYHNSQNLFGRDEFPQPTRDLTTDKLAVPAREAHSRSDFLTQTWGQWDWPLTLSTPERAVLDLLDELPERESFHQVDKLMEGLSNLSPHRLQKLLCKCQS